MRISDWSSDVCSSDLCHNPSPVADRSGVDINSHESLCSDRTAGNRADGQDEECAMMTRSITLFARTVLTNLAVAFLLVTPARASDPPVVTIAQGALSG